METPDTESGTVGSLELIHEEAEEINRSMDLSLAFWGPARDQPDMVSATKLKCVLEKPSRASETAVLIWEKMRQEELENVKQVERILMKDGEISTDTLFKSFKNIIEGVGFTLETILYEVEAIDAIPLVTNIMSELLYIYNQNEPPEISETDEYSQIYEGEGYIPFAMMEHRFPSIDSEDDESKELTKKMESLLEKAKELNLGEIKVPSTPLLSAASKLATVERQVKSKLRLRNIRKLIETKKNNNINKSIDLTDKIPPEKPKGKSYKLKRDTYRKPSSQNYSTNRPVFRTAVKSQSLEYDSMLNQATTLQKRIKRASQIRKKLVEEKAKLECIVGSEKNGQNGSKVMVLSSKNLGKKGNFGKSITKNEKLDNKYDPYTSKRTWSPKRDQTYPQLSHNDNFKDDEDIDYSQDGENFPNRCLGSNVQFSQHAQHQNSANIIQSIRDSNSEEYHVINDDEEMLCATGNSSEINYGEIPKVSENNCELFVSNEDSKNMNINCMGDEGLTNTIPAAPNVHHGSKSSCEERPCSRDEMLSEMKKMLKEALTEVVCSNSVHQFRQNYLDLDPERETQIERREILERKAMECQTNDSAFNIREAKCRNLLCNCCDKDDTVDVDRKLEEDVLDIKITQEGSMPPTWTITGDPDGKMSTEISVSQNGSGPAVKVSVVSRVKSNEDTHSLMQKEKGEQQHQDSVKAAFNILKDYLAVTTPENNLEKELTSDHFDESICYQTSISDENETTISKSNDTKTFPSYLENSRASNYLVPESDDLPPISVNLAMLLQGCSCPREEMRACGPFQIGGVLLSDSSPTRIEGDIGDGSDLHYPEPWTDCWPSQVWRENFVSPSPAFTESDSLYVNTSDDTLVPVANREGDEPNAPPTASSPDPVQLNEESVVKRVYSRAGSFLAELLGYIISPFMYSYSVLKSSATKLYRGNNEDVNTNESSNSGNTSQT